MTKIYLAGPFPDSREAPEGYEGGKKKYNQMRLMRRSSRGGRRCAYLMSFHYRVRTEEMAEYVRDHNERIANE